MKEQYYEYLDELSHDLADTSLLDWSTRMGYEILAEKLLRKGISLESLYGALFNAAKFGQLQIIKLLVEHGINRHRLMGYALALAIENGHLGVVEYLVNHGMSIPQRFRDALISASGYGHLPIVRFFVERETNIDSLNDALAAAVIGGHINVIKYLLDHGADLKSLGSLTLNQAIRYGHSNVVDYVTKLSRNQNH